MKTNDTQHERVMLERSVALACVVASTVVISSL